MRPKAAPATHNLHGVAGLGTLGVPCGDSGYGDSGGSRGQMAARGLPPNVTLTDRMLILSLRWCSTSDGIP